MFTKYPKTMTLKNGKEVVVRPLARNDFARLHAFFSGLDAEDRMFLRDDVSDPDLVRRWTQHIDFERVIPLVALDEDAIVADGTLHISAHGWMRHVGLMRLVVAKTHRKKGLGVLLAHELVNLAAEKNLEKLRVQIIEDDIGSVKMLEAVGFQRLAVLENLVKDRAGEARNLLVMINDVSDLDRIMEDWFQSIMIPQFRVPGGDGA